MPWHLGNFVAKQCFNQKELNAYILIYSIDNNLRDDHDPVWCFLENVRDPANPKSGCYSDTRWSAKDGRFWSARACDGLPPIEGNEVIEVMATKLRSLSISV